MTYEAKIVADSISILGPRITTMQLTYPRYIHAELMTHRVFSRNASSSRAIPTTKLIENSLRDMVYPIEWGKNQAGMQAKAELLSEAEQREAAYIWESMANFCAEGVRRLSEIGLHKQWANRPLEWFGNITTLVTTTTWENWDELRDHEMAQPEIHNLARLMKIERAFSEPKVLDPGEWHLPYILDEERSHLTVDTLLKISTARCARVSYLTQEGISPTISKDLELYDRLVGSVPLHASPCEHQATPAGDPTASSGNFCGWVQHRKLLEEKLWETLTHEIG
jgi:thymidylate synthase ThyX